MIAVPNPRTIHVPSAGIGRELLVEQVLDDRKAGADGKAGDRGIDEKADAMRADQRDDDERFGELLDGGSDIARCTS